MLTNEIIGKRSDVFSVSYTWRDIILYAIAVGAKQDDLDYVFEKNLKVLPTFGTLPCFATIGVTPTKPESLHYLVEEYITDSAGLHMEHELIMHRQFNPMGGDFTFQTEIAALYDRGPGKGAVRTERIVMYDNEGNAICTNNANLILLGEGGFGGDQMPKSDVLIPGRAPDIELDDALSPEQHLIYRLTGDTNNVHVDPEAARREGVDRPFMHGLCSFGYVCRMAVGALMPGQPEKMTRIAAQMRSILFPGSSIRLQLWDKDPGSAYFRLLNLSNDNALILERGIIEWTP